MIPRKHIIPERSFLHVFFRCHNRQFFLKSPEVKLKLLLLWAKNKIRYNVRIYEWAIMDNHVHLLVRAENAEDLGNFMRTVSSQLARFINQEYSRDSQAIRERFKSPLITNKKYLLKVIPYIWMNRYKATGQRPEQDIYNSLFWRLNKNASSVICNDRKNQKLLDSLLDPVESLPIKVGDPKKFIYSLLNRCKSEIDFVFEKLMTNVHTIGDEFDVKFRAELLNAFRRPPPLRV